MKKITTATTLGGAPISLADLKTVFNDELWDVIEAILQTVTQASIVSGCAVTGAGPHDISAGIVFINGGFYRFAGATGVTLPQYISPGALTNVSAVFSDGVTRNLFTTQDAVISGVDPGGVRLVISSTTPRTFGTAFDERVLKQGDTMTGALINTSTGEFQGGIRTQSSGPFFGVKRFDIGAWDMDTSSQVTIAHGLNWEKIISVSCFIWDDDGTVDKKELTSNVTGVTGAIAYDATNIFLTRITGGIFDSTSYNNTGVNRGKVAVFYEMT